MILADKILNLRKKSGWSQEELADKLNVSRQSVSKWESAQATPDLNRIIEMSKIFGVSTDYLLKDEYEEISEELKVDYPDVKQVSLQEANKYLEVKEKSAKDISFGVYLCILSPIALLILIALSEESVMGFTNANVAVAVGVIILLGFIAVAVTKFVKSEMNLEPYKYIEKEIIDTAYGVDGLVKEKMEELRPRKVSETITAIVLMIVSPVSIFFVLMTTGKGSHYIIASAVLLLMVAIGVKMLVKNDEIWNSYLALKQNGTFSEEKKKEVKNSSYVIDNIYWPIIVTIYLGYSLITNDWARSWIIWPIAGVLSAALSGLIDYFSKK